MVRGRGQGFRAVGALVFVLDFVLDGPSKHNIVQYYNCLKSLILLMHTKQHCMLGPITNQPLYQLS
jgi:endo-alpha-1,4-polygalactosaminidase (GH114 family)